MALTRTSYKAPWCYATDYGWKCSQLAAGVQRSWTGSRKAGPWSWPLARPWKPTLILIWARPWRC